MTTATTPSCIAHLRDADRDDYDHIIHGVAHGEEEFTRGLNGPKYWPAEEVEQAAATLEGRPVYRDHGDDTDREEIGAVLRAAYEPGVGVVYEAGLEDAEAAEELSLGQREVSIEAGNPDTVDRHEATGAAILRDYEYTALTTPENGASPGNYTAPGAAADNPAVAALSAGDLEAVLDGDAETAVLADLSEIAVDDVVAWRTGNGTLGYGRVRGRILGGRYDHELDADRVVSAPAILITVYEPRGGKEWAATDRTVARKPESVRVREGFPAAPAAEATDAALSDWQTVAGVRFRDTRKGKLDKSALEKDEHDLDNHALYGSGDDKGDYSYWVVDADGYLRRGNVASAWELGCRGQCDDSEAHDEKVLQLNQQFDQPPITPDDESAAAAASQPDDATLAEVLGVEYEHEHEHEPGATTGSEEDSMSDPDPDDDTTNDLTALLERVDAKDEEIDSLEAELEETEADLEAKEERIAELEAENEQLREQNEAAREQYAAALAEASPLFDEEELIENYTLAELAAKVEEADVGDGGDTDPVIRSGSGSAEANLSAAEQERKQEIEARLAELEDKDGALAEKETERLEDELAELSGGAA